MTQCAMIVARSTNVEDDTHDLSQAILLCDGATTSVAGVDQQPVWGLRACPARDVSRPLRPMPGSEGNWVNGADLWSERLTEYVFIIHAKLSFSKPLGNFHRSREDL